MVALGRFAECGSFEVICNHFYQVYDAISAMAFKEFGNIRVYKAFWVALKKKCNGVKTHYSTKKVLTQLKYNWSFIYLQVMIFDRRKGVLRI